VEGGELVAKVQRYFERFDEAIRLGRFDENATLREKRDIIRQKLKDNLPDEFDDQGEECPSFRFVDQGSYELGTGIEPVAGDFDIDQGLYFELASGDYSDPVVLKNRIRDSLFGHTNKVLIRRSCVTVFYQRDDEDIYHVDLAVYREATTGGLPEIGKGKEHSDPENRYWETSDPSGLSMWFTAALDDAERKQLRRLVRYLKRWKDERFRSDGNAAPTGIALTVAARSNYAARYFDSVAKTPDDLGALTNAVTLVLGQFVTKLEGNAGQFHRLEVRLPVQPYADLLETMSDMQSESLYQKLTALKNALLDAGKAVDPVEACRRLRSVLGLDFPVPDPPETATKSGPTILGSSASA
jgi:hypothetical protein